MMMNRVWCWAVVAGFLASGCATTAPLGRQACYNPDAQLAAVLQPFEALRARGCRPAASGRDPGDCEKLRQEIQRLAIVCSEHVPTLMANAVIAYDTRQISQAQQFLDRIFVQPRSYPDAAVLRARIAVDEGNLPFARRLLEQQIKLTPDHAGLHETLGATLYLTGQLAEASQQLNTAAALGAPRWRVAYHLGLVDEAAGRPAEARRHFEEAVAANPDAALAQSHLNGLRAAGGVAGAR